MVTTTLWQQRVGETDSIRSIARAKEAAIPARDLALDRLISELVCAFFVAMAVMWVVTTIAGIFS
jgi:hypothetical protein